METGRQGEREGELLVLRAIGVYLQTPQHKSDSCNSPSPSGVALPLQSPADNLPLHHRLLLFPLLLLRLVQQGQGTQDLCVARLPASEQSCQDHTSVAISCTHSTRMCVRVCVRVWSIAYHFHPYV